jgi:hypothetical protein
LVFNTSNGFFIFISPLRGGLTIQRSFADFPTVNLSGNGGNVTKVHG